MFGDGRFLGALAFPVNYSRVVFRGRTPLCVPRLGIARSGLAIDKRIGFSSRLCTSKGVRVVIIMFRPRTVDVFLGVPASLFCGRRISNCDLRGGDLGRLTAQVFSYRGGSVYVDCVRG